MTNPKPNGGERSIVMSFYRAFKSLGAALPTLLGVRPPSGTFPNPCIKTLYCICVYRRIAS